MFGRKSYRSVAFALLVAPLLIVTSATCYTNMAVSRENLRGGEYPERQELRLYYPDGTVLLDFDWTLDYPMIEGRVIDVAGDNPGAPIAGKDDWYRFDAERAERIEILKLSRGKTAGLLVGSSALAAVILYAIVAMIAAAAVLSCPAVYIHDGPAVQLVGSALPGSMMIPSTSEDLLAIPSPRGDRLVVEIRTEHQEKVFLDSVTLLHVPRAAGTVVVPSVNGTVAVGPSHPLDQARWNGRDVRFEVSEPDKRAWQTTVPSGNRRGSRDQIECEVVAPSSGDYALLLSLQNTSWYEVTLAAYLGQSRNLAPERSGRWDPFWQETEGLVLEAQRLDVTGWRTIAGIEPRGREGWRSIAVPIGRAIQGETIRMQLVSGRGFWQVDHIGLVRIIDDPQPLRLMPRASESLAEAKLEAANGTTVRMWPGDSLTFEFDVPGGLPDDGQWFLATRGWYEPIPQPAWERLGELMPLKEPTIENVSREIERLLLQ